MTVEFVYDNDENAGYYGRLISPRDKKKLKRQLQLFLSIEKVSHYLYSEFISHNFDFVSQNSVKKNVKIARYILSIFSFSSQFRVCISQF